MPKIESEKIDCLHRPCSRPAPRGKIESVRTIFDILFRCSNSCFLLETNIAGHQRLFLAKWHPKAEEKLRRRPFFDIADRHDKLYGRSRLYASAQGRHETGGVLSLFSSLSFDISMKNSVERWSSDIQGLFRVKIRKMALGTNDLSTLPLTIAWVITTSRWARKLDHSKKEGGGKPCSVTQSSRAGWHYREGNSSFSGPAPQSLGVCAAFFCDQARSNWDSMTSATQFHCPKLYMYITQQWNILV